MKAVIISEVALDLTRKQLIADLGKALAEREARIKSGDVTGMVAHPEQVVEYHIGKAFHLLVNG